MKRKGRKKILSNGQKKINLINRNRKSDDDENDSNGQELYLLKKKKIFQFLHFNHPKKNIMKTNKKKLRRLY